MAAAMLADINLDNLIQAKQVSVVQELDVGSLKATLQALIDAFNHKAAADAPTREDLQALADQVGQLRQESTEKDAKIAELVANQEKLQAQLDKKTDKDEAMDPMALQHLAGKQAALDEKVSRLEDMLHGQGPDAVVPRVDQLDGKVKDLQQALGAAQNTSDRGNAAGAGAEAVATGMDGASAPFAASSAAAILPGAADDGQLKKDVADLARRQKDIEAGLADLRKSQDDVKKAQRESDGNSEDAKLASTDAAKKIGEQQAQLEALRSAIEAINNGEKVELPPPAPVAEAVDLGPIERRLGKKADADDVAVLEGRLADLEAAMKGARAAAEDAERQSADAGRQVTDLRQCIADGLQAAPANSAVAANPTIINNTTNTTSTTDLSDIRKEISELRSLVESLTHKTQEAPAASDLAAVRADLEQLMKALDGKASQADLDAMMGAGAMAPSAALSAGGGGGDSEPPPALDPASATTDTLAITVNDIKAQISSMQALLQVLQGRLGEKASAMEVDQLKRSTAGLAEKVTVVEKTLETKTNESVTNKLVERINTIEKQLETIKTSIASATAATGAAGAASAADMGTVKGAAGRAANAADTSHLEVALSSCRADISSALQAIEELRRLVAESGQAQAASDLSLSALGDAMKSLREAIGNKADRSELDALLEGGFTGGGDGAGGGDGGGLAAGLDGSSDTSELVKALQELSAKVSTFGASQKVMQERMGTKADRADLDSKANQAVLNNLQAALGAKADQSVLANLQAALGAKADRSLLDRLQGHIAVMQKEQDKLRGLLAARVAGSAVLTTASAASPLADAGAAATAAADIRPLESNGIVSPGVSDLLDQLGRKADRSEVQQLHDALAKLAAQLPQGVPSGLMPQRPASPKERLDARRSITGGAGGAPGGPDDGLLGSKLSALEKQTADLSAGLEMLAHAVNILCVGEAQAVVPISGRTKYLPMAATAAASSGGGAAAGAGSGAGDAAGAGGGSAGGGIDGSDGRHASPGAVGLASAKNGVAFGKDGTPRGALDKLRDLYRLKQYNRKMDWFDPAWLQDLARRVGELEGAVNSLKKSSTKQPYTDAMPPRSSGGAKDYDKIIMKLGRDIGNLRKQLNDMAGEGTAGRMGGGMQRVPDGDHAMLSAKPLLGYRCMACDRPLEKLDEKPGPYVPSNQMPVNVTPYERRGIGMPAGLESPPKPLHAAPTIDPVGKSNADGRGPQNWYQDVHGPAANNLPAGDVGPHLPPGGWRGNEQPQPPPGGHNRRHSRSSFNGDRHGGEGLSANGLQPQEGSYTSLPNIK